ncbi:MAG: glycosyltransferase family 4 protein [Kiloniellales bacterium]|nr:glycosyltransferase family 4 protein [Kiloniellales bacterium]
MKILTFSTLYPNAAQPNHGVFVENRLRKVVETGRLEASVIAPVPWFPFRSEAFGSYATFAKAPRSEERHGLRVHHPRYPLIPKVGMTAAPLLMYAAVKPALGRLMARGLSFDLIDAHYFYPDGVAAAMLARDLAKPLVITARGTDLNLIPRYALPRRMIQWAAARADGLITVCQALKDELVRLGVAGEKVRVLSNGVDLELFTPGPGADLRASLGLSGPLLLSAGHLIPRKGHDLVIRAMAHLPEAGLVVVGEGPERPALEALIASLGLAERVRLLGSVAHARMAEHYRAADVLVLASSREGWANVLLEAMACGTPVAASNIWGTPEVVAERAAGVLFEERTPEAIAAAITRLLADPPTREETRRYATGFSWDTTTQGQLRLFGDVLDERMSASSAG